MTLPENAILAALRADFGLPVQYVQPHGDGYDTLAATYRARAADADYFVKVTRRPLAPLTLQLAGFLQRAGLPGVVGPIPARDGALAVSLAGGAAMLVYPFVEGQSMWGRSLTEAQWSALGQMLRALHGAVDHAALPQDLRAAIRSETFIPPEKHTAIMGELHAAIPTTDYVDPHQQQLAEFWRALHACIGHLMARTAQLSRHMQQRTDVTRVLCHGDIHLGNVMRDAAGALHMVDWDDVIHAPKERDLMFVTVGGFNNDPGAEAAFFRGYGPTAIDPVMLAYYRYERALEDLAEFAEGVFFRETDARQDALNWFQRQFAPDGLIAAAQALNHALSPL